MSAADAYGAEKVLDSIAATIQAAGVELLATDHTPTKASVAAVYANAALAAATKGLSPPNKAILQAAIDAFNKVSPLVGGPIL